MGLELVPPRPKWKYRLVAAEKIDSASIRKIAGLLKCNIETNYTSSERQNHVWSKIGVYSLTEDAEASFAIDIDTQEELEFEL